MSEFLTVNFLTTFYFWLGVSMTVLFIIKLIIFSVSGIDDSAGDLVGTDIDTDFNFLSLQSILAFLMGFGWMGYATLEWELTPVISVIVAFGGGLVLMLLSAYLMSLVKRLNSTPKYDIKACVEKTGTSYVRFAPKGMGKIQIEFNGKLEIFDAWNDTDNEIESFKQIKVVRVEDDKLFIVEI